MSEHLDPDKFVSALDAASILGVKKDTVKHWCLEGKIKGCVKTSQFNKWPDTAETWYLTKDSVADLLNEKEVACLHWKQYNSERSIESVLKTAREKFKNYETEIIKYKDSVQDMVQESIDTLYEFDTRWLKNAYEAMLKNRCKFVRIDTVQRPDDEMASFFKLENPFPEIDFNHLKKSDVKTICKTLKAEESRIQALVNCMASCIAAMEKSRIRSECIMDMVQGRLYGCDNSEAEADAALAAM